ncbi:recombinase family protein [Alkaliphilus pronyensis]|uniref:Recombinase family protein n=1 Tax=Alkaliphilus pronyensis TaxID=1482732 RepID=A0A6I0F922_9FIRM|nr:recombinase family protein [Alkaliphilus pronyensis]KAB3538585.1 recombinase family protein [Alkaliphilus pronyensis]
MSLWWVIRLRVYGYVRLSRDEDKENYSSILQQKNIIMERAKELGYSVLAIYEDDNVSGYIFERPALNRLTEKIQQGEVDVLITKDSSRVGRHNAKTLLFFELLKERNIRLILATEGYDSYRDSDDILGIRTWYNEMYIKDISRKITENIRSKQKNEGLVVKSQYGYIKDPNNKHRLIIDDEAAEIVKKIFKLYINGLGYRKIAEKLNTLEIPTPSQYLKKKKGGKFKTSGKWSNVHVQRIINNDIYIGVLRCGKTMKKTIKGASYRVEEEKQIVHENHHPSIISKNEFKLAMEVNYRRNKRLIRGGNSGINLFSGFLYCNECGSYMIARKRKNNSIAYYCGQYHKYGKKACTTHFILQDNLKEALNKEIKSLLLGGNINQQNIISKIISLKKATSNLEERINKLCFNIDSKKIEIKNYIKLWARNQLKHDIYQELVREGYNDINIMEATLESLHEKKNNRQQIEDEMKDPMFLENKINSLEICRDDIEALIDRIMIKQTFATDSYIEATVHWSFKGSICYHNQVDVRLDRDQ